MKTEQSIVLQKKMILFLSLMIMIFFSIVYLQKNLPNEKLASQTKTIENKVITVERQSEDEIERKNIKYLMAKLIENDENLAEQNEQALEIDVTSTEKQAEIENSVANSSVTISEEEAQEVLSVIIPSHNAPNLIFDDEKEEVTVEETPQVINTAYAEKNEGNGLPTEYASTIEVTATAYCLCKSCCGKNPTDPYYGYTASGLKIIPGTGMKVIAVDPSIIPLNTKVYVEGLNGAWDYGYAIAADTGGAIKNLKIDLYMDSHAEALKWGRRPVKVYLLNQ